MDAFRPFMYPSLELSGTMRNNVVLNNFAAHGGCKVREKLKERIMSPFIKDGPTTPYSASLCFTYWKVWINATQLQTNALHHWQVWEVYVNALPLVWYPHSVPPHRKVARHGLRRGFLAFIAVQCHAAIRLINTQTQIYIYYESLWQLWFILLVSTGLIQFYSETAGGE